MTDQFDGDRRRAFLLAAAATTAAAALPAGSATMTVAPAQLPDKAEPLPLSAVRLLPSPYLDAVNANRRYLLTLEPDRLLHNFMTSAGLKPKGEVYGGWEKDTIAGHTLGHYLGALSLMHAQTGLTDKAGKLDKQDELCRRVACIVEQLGAAQQAHGDGYVGGFTRKRKDGSIVDGKEIFAEIMRGDIRSAGFDLNGCWVPLYNWHKLFAGLFDAHKYCGNRQALTVAVNLGVYVDRVFAALNDEQVQTVLACEHGGINESFAELFALTKDPRWLRLAQRLYHRKVLDPLAQERDELANLHANTQVPKLVGLARLFELAGKPADAVAPRFFWNTVTANHSYVIGGNADREYFQAPRSIATHITEQTCEACNTYNMLRLTRHLFAWRPDAALFDYYERAHLNHILAQQNPQTGMFTYMTPLMSGIAREFSEPFESFWCCVGSGMESHAKHGDSIWWQGGQGAAETMFVNLYIPSRAFWQSRRAEFALNTRYPYEGRVEIELAKLGVPGEFTLALRIPAWVSEPISLSVNGKAATTVRHAGYVLLRRRWRAGDKVVLELPLALRLEATPGDDGTVAVLRGPMVLAADLGSIDKPFEAASPALVGNDLLRGFAPTNEHAAEYRTSGIGRPGELTFSPFYKNYERRSAVYFRRFTDAGWARAEVAFAAEQARLNDLAARSVDVMHLGDMQPERDHELASEISYPVIYRGRRGRDARTGGFFSFRMKVRPGPLVLQATYWGDERNRHFHILVDGTRIASQTLEANQPGAFIDIDYPIAEALTHGKAYVLVRFDPEPGRTAGPVFGCRIFAPAAAGA